MKSVRLTKRDADDLISIESTSNNSLNHYPTLLEFQASKHLSLDHPQEDGSMELAIKLEKSLC